MTTTPVAERLRSQAARTPELVAVETDDTAFTYAELDAWVDRESRRLIDAGAGPERVVAVALPRSPAFVVSLLAVNRAGAAYLPIDPDLPLDRIDYLLRDAAPATVIHGDGTDWIAEAAHTATLRIAEPPTAAPVAGPDAVRTDIPVYLIYTSGSTGRPKGVVMCAEAIDNLLDWHLDELGTGPGRRVAQFTAIGFDIAAQEIFSTLVCGATLVIPGEETRRDPWRLVRWLARRRITDLFAPNLIVEAVCDTALAHGFPLPELRHVAQAGEQLTLSHAVRTFFRIQPGRRLYNHYGPTETHAATSYVLPLSPQDWPDRAPVGQPIWNTEVHLLDANLEQVPEGADGEVFVSGTAMARGYHGRPDLTADRFLPDPFGAAGGRMYRTGDIARRRPDGLLEYLGRADQQVKIRGVRVELGEIDAAIRAMAEVRDVAVLARGDGAARRLDAYLVPVPGAREVVERVRQHLTATLPPVMVPATFTLLTELPANSNGKVDRNALPEPGRAVAGVTSDRDSVVARLFAECLEVDAVHADDDFFELGGHSLSAAKLAGQLRSMLGVEVTIADIFRNPNVGKLTEALHASGTNAPPVVPVDHGERVPVSFAQERLWILDLFSGPNARYNVGVAIRLTGPLNRTALAEAINDLPRRHEALRTRIVSDDSGLWQTGFAADPVVDLPVVDGLDRQTVDAAVGEAAREAFDLGVDPPLRARLFGYGDDRHVLLLLIHHIAVDGWSVKPLAKDLGFAYSARLAGLAPPWQRLPVGYADYAVWQRRLFDSGEPSEFASDQTEYWRRTLDGAPELTTLATDRPRPEILSDSGDRVAVTIGPDLHARLQATARQAGCTVFMVVHAALAILLRSRGAGDDIVIGATVAGRSDGTLDDLVGLFVNTLALRVDLTGDPTMSEVLRRVREVDLAAIEHQELPFDRVVEVRNPARTMAYNPVVQVMLAFQVGPPEAPQMPGLHTAVEVLDLKVAKFDLTFELTERFDGSATPDGITGHLEYATDLFDHSTAANMVNDLHVLLRIVAEERELRLDNLGAGIERS